MSQRTRPAATARFAIVILLLTVIGSAFAASRRAGPVPESRQPVTLSIVGTSDLHGAVFERNGRGGLALLGGYLRNLRAARMADGGAVLLLDAGDTYQGGIESNLSEGALVVDAYDALEYTAAAIGNHEFDFGPVDVSGRRLSPDADPQGALKAIAARAGFPLLAANLVDEATGLPVSWPNVRPSVMVEAAGLKIGLVGVMTIDALHKTLVVNTRGLRVTPLAPAIAGEAAKLRAAGARVIVVVAHAGGRCREFQSPTDLSSCDSGSEIFQVARALPRGLVDAIVAGHAHAGLAHVVNGVPIIESYSHGRAFGRIDLVVDSVRGAVVASRVFAPRQLCPRADPVTGGCDPSMEAGPLEPATYEGQPVRPDPAVADAMAPALRQVRALQETPLGALAETALPRSLDGGSPLGNLFAEALRASVPGADVAVVNSSPRGGLRADLPQGPITFGLVYDVFPFDNQVARLNLTGGDLARALQAAIGRNRNFVLGLAGAYPRRDCSADPPRLVLERASGEPIGEKEPLLVVTTEMLASGALFAPALGPGRHVPARDAPVAREVVADWIRGRGGRMSAAEFSAEVRGTFSSAVPCLR